MATNGGRNGRRMSNLSISEDIKGHLACFFHDFEFRPNVVNNYWFFTIIM